MGFNTSFGTSGSGGTGSTTFTGLTDTPSSYSGQAGKVVKVNAGETALVFEDGAGGTTPIDSAYETVALMVAATDITTGDTVATYGYHALSDGGEMVYTVTDTDLSGDVDGGSVIALANSLYAQAQFPPYYRPEMWGAKASNSSADASNNVSAMNAMFLYNTDNIKPVYFSQGTYYINESVQLSVKQSADQYRYYGNGCTIRSTGRSTSATANLPIQTGSVTVTVADETGFQVGEQCRLTPGNSTGFGFGANNLMQGEITGIVGRDITVNVTETRLFEYALQRDIDLDAYTTGDNYRTGGWPNWNGFNVGQVVRVEYDASNYFEGTVSLNQSNGNLWIDNITVVGSGSYDRWQVTVQSWTYSGSWAVKGGIEMFKRTIPNQTYAAGAVSSKVQFDGFNFYGNGNFGLDVGLSYACAYGSSVTNMTFRNCYKGWWGQFMLMTYYANIMMYCDIGMDCTYGYEWGGNTANAASNVATMENIRSFAANGSIASIRVLGSNSYYLLNFIEEGYPKQYGIWWDASNSTNTINLYLDEVHLEVSDFDSFIRCDRIQVLRCNIKGIYPQYPNIILNNTDTNSPAYLTLTAYYWLGQDYLYRGNVQVYHEQPSAAYPTSTGFGSGKNCWPNSVGGVGYVYGTSANNPTFGTGDSSYDFGTGSMTGNGLSAGTVNSRFQAQNVFSIGGDSAILHIRGRSNHFWGDGAITSKGSATPMDIVHSGTINPQPLRIYSGSTTNAKLRWYRSSGTKTYYNDNSYSDEANATQMWSIPNAAGSAGTVLKHDGTADCAWDYVDFLELGDVTDTTYSGKAGYVAKVNAGETGIELVPSTTPTPSSTAGTILGFDYLQNRSAAASWILSPVADGGDGEVFDTGVSVTFTVPASLKVQVEVGAYIYYAGEISKVEVNYVITTGTDFTIGGGFADAGTNRQNKVFQAGLENNEQGAFITTTGIGEYTTSGGSVTLNLGITRNAGTAIATEIQYGVGYPAIYMKVIELPA